jgi:uncharacterized SAM-binding protein YcdF (DUF218 family)
MLTSPANWLAAFCVAGTLLLWVRWEWQGRLLLTVAALGFSAVAFLPLDQWALAPLENRFPPLVPVQHYDGILVLGGALESAMTDDRHIPSLNAAAERLTEFARQIRLHPEARAVFTGGPLPNRPDGPPEAVGVRLLLGDLGVDVSKVMFEDRSLTTWENAVLTDRLVSHPPGERWLLITSAAHMPRSIGAFRAVGWELQADPVGYKSFADPQKRAARFLSERLSLLDVAAHEWIGLAYYWLRGRSHALFPAP